MSLLSLLLIAIGFNLIGFGLAYDAATDKLTDFSYGATFLIVAWLAFSGGDKHKPEAMLFGLIALWAVRLAGFLVLRILRINKDRRFDGVREDFWKFAKFWVGQAAVAWVIMLPAIFMLRGSGAVFGAGALAGWLISFIGLCIEMIADAQKYNFNLEPGNDGKWIASGLWKFSRHPNYFGEILMWIGVYVYSFSYISGAERVFGLLSPLLITYLLVFVTGIPRLESYADKKWGRQADYKKYKSTTSPLVPLPRLAVKLYRSRQLTAKSQTSG